MAEQTENRDFGGAPAPKRTRDERRPTRTFDYAVLVSLLVVFLAILEVMAREAVKPEVLTVLGASLGLVLGGILQSATHLWGAPKKTDGQLPPQGQ